MEGWLVELGVGADVTGGGIKLGGTAGISGPFLLSAKTTSARLVMKNKAASHAVARVRRLADPRVVRNPDIPPPPPRPNPPPSLFCNKIIPTNKTANIK